MFPGEGYVTVDNAELFFREIGKGQSIIVIHGGPDFDHTYLLPDMDRLSDSYRLIYYDQRGRGKSRGEFRLDDIYVEKYVDDLDRLRRYFQLDSIVLLGHSWGGHLAMQYAIHCPNRVSHMILMNTAPASYEDNLLMQQEIQRKRALYEEKLNALASSLRYLEGNPESVSEYYKIAFSSTFKNPELLQRLNLSWTSEDIQRGRAIENQLLNELYWAEGFSIMPQLKELRIPTLILHGEIDFIPVACAAHIAEMIPFARLTILAESGHFSYIDAPKRVRSSIDEFLTSS